MSWDVTFSTANPTMGTKQIVRDQFLSACENFSGKEIPRQGPTNIELHPKFSYEALFIGSKHAIASLTLAIHCVDDPHTNDEHPVWEFIKCDAEQNGWDAHDSFTGNQIANDR